MRVPYQNVQSTRAFKGRKRSGMSGTAGASIPSTSPRRKFRQVPRKCRAEKIYIAVMTIIISAHREARRGEARRDETRGEGQRETDSRRILWAMLVLHFNIGKSKLSSLPMTMRLVRLTGLIALALMELNRRAGNMRRE